MFSTSKFNILRDERADRAAARDDSIAIERAIDAQRRGETSESQRSSEKKKSCARELLARR